MEETKEKLPIPISITKKILSIVAVLLLFIVALEVIKKSVSVVLQNRVRTHIQTHVSGKQWKQFSAGYLGTAFLMSGSPVAATGVSLFASSEQEQLFTTHDLRSLILGARSGPDVVLFLIGIIALLKGHSPRRAFGLGVIEFLVTISVVAGTLLFTPLMANAAEKFAPALTLGSRYKNFIGAWIEPFIEHVAEKLPALLVLLGGIGLLFLAILIFDKIFSFLDLPREEDTPLREAVHEDLRLLVSKPKEAFKHIPARMWQATKAPFHFLAHLVRPNLRDRIIDHIKQPFPAFLLGFLITLLTMSTAVSVGIIVPLYTYRAINIGSVIPYILAANLATYLDTLFLAILTQSTAATATVLSIILGTAATIILFILLYKLYFFAISHLAAFITERRWVFAGTFTLAIGLPVALLFIG